MRVCKDKPIYIQYNIYIYLCIVVILQFYRIVSLCTKIRVVVSESKQRKQNHESTSRIRVPGRSESAIQSLSRVTGGEICIADSKTFYLLQDKCRYSLAYACASMYIVCILMYIVCILYVYCKKCTYTHTPAMSPQNTKLGSK